MLESGSGASSASHASSEAASTEAASTAEAASSTKNDRTAAATSAIVFVVRLLTAHYCVPAVAASIGDVFRPYAVMARDEPAVAALQFVLSAVGTFAGVAHGYDGQYAAYRNESE